MALSFEDSRSVAQFYGMRQLLQDTIETPEEVLRQIQAVSIADVQALAAELVREGELRLGVIGPFEEKNFARFVS